MLQSQLGCLLDRVSKFSGFFYFLWGWALIVSVSCWTSFCFVLFSCPWMWIRPCNGKWKSLLTSLWISAFNVNMHWHRIKFTPVKRPWPLLKSHLSFLFLFRHSARERTTPASSMINIFKICTRGHTADTVSPRISRTKILHKNSLCSKRCSSVPLSVKFYSGFIGRNSL